MLLMSASTGPTGSMPGVYKRQTICLGIRVSSPQTPEAIEAWAAALAQRFQGRPVAVALEQSRGALLFALTKYVHLILYPINPARLAHYRKSFRPSGAKDDPSDAELLLNYLCNHRDQLRPLQPDTEDTRALQFLVEARRRTVDDKTRFKNRLTAVLKQYYPQILDWFADVDSAVVLDLLERWPTLGDLQRVHRPSFDHFLNNTGGGGFRRRKNDGNKSSLQFQQRKISPC